MLAKRSLLLVFQRTGAVDHTHVALAAIRARWKQVDEPLAALSAGRDHQPEHILVDEFQDTSSSQAELLGIDAAGLNTTRQVLRPGPYS